MKLDTGWRLAEAPSFPLSVFLASGTFDFVGGEDSGTVTGAAAPSAPTRVILNMRIPSGGLDIRANSIDGTLTDDGFDFILDGVVPGVGYFLDWVMI